MIVCWRISADLLCLLRRVWLFGGMYRFIRSYANSPLHFRFPCSTFARHGALNRALPPARPDYFASRARTFRAIYIETVSRWSRESWLSLMLHTVLFRFLQEIDSPEASRVAIFVSCLRAGLSGNTSFMHGRIRPRYSKNLLDWSHSVRTCEGSPGTNNVHDLLLLSLRQVAAEFS